MISYDFIGGISLSFFRVFFLSLLSLFLSLSVCLSHSLSVSYSLPLSLTASFSVSPCLSLSLSLPLSLRSRLLYSNYQYSRTVRLFAQTFKFIRALAVMHSYICSLTVWFIYCFHSLKKVAKKTLLTSPHPPSSLVTTFFSDFLFELQKKSLFLRLPLLILINCKLHDVSPFRHYINNYNNLYVMFWLLVTF